MIPDRFQIPALLLVLLIGVGGGLVAGMMLAEPEPGTASRRTETTVAPITPTIPAPRDTKASAPAPTAVPTPESTPRPASQPRESATAPVAGDLRGRLEQALSGIAPHVRQVGNGQITGKLTMENTGLPLTGILIEAVGQDDSSSYLATPRPKPTRDPVPQTEYNLAEVAERAVESTRNLLNRYYHTTTGSDGSYTLAGLPESLKYRITPRSSQYQFEFVSGGDAFRYSSATCKPGDVADFTATRQWYVQVDVLLPDGSPAKGMNLRYGHMTAATDRAMAESLLKGFRLSTGTSWGGPGDHITFPQGFNALTAEPTGEAGLFSADPVVVHAGEGGDTAVTIRLRAVPGVIVRIQDDSGDGRNLSREIQCMPWVGDKPPTRQQFREYDRRGGTNPAYERKWGSDLSKPIVFKGLNPGRHIVAVIGDDQMLAHAFFESDDTVHEITLVIPPPAREDYLMLWVKDPTGNPIRKDVRIHTRVQSKSGGSSGSGNAASAMLDGWWRLKHHGREEPVGKSEDATWTITVSHDAYGIMTEQYKPGPASELTVQFQQPATVEIVVDGMQGHAAKDLLIARLAPVVEANSNRSVSDIRLTPTDTGFVTSAMQPGKFTAHLMLNGGSGSYSALELSKVEVTAVAGKNTVRLSAPPLYSVTFSLPGVRAGARVNVNRVKDERSSDGMGRWSREETQSRTVDDTRIAIFEHLPAGRYQVSVSNTGNQSYRETEITLPGQSVVVLSPR